MATIWSFSLCTKDADLVAFTDQIVKVLTVENLFVNFQGKPVPDADDEAGMIR